MQFKAICVKRQNSEHRRRDRKAFFSSEYLPFSKYCRQGVGGNAHSTVSIHRLRERGSEREIMQVT